MGKSGHWYYWGQKQVDNIYISGNHYKFEYIWDIYEANGKTGLAIAKELEEVLQGEHLKDVVTWVKNSNEKRSWDPKDPTSPRDTWTPDIDIFKYILEFFLKQAKDNPDSVFRIDDYDEYY